MTRTLANRMEKTIKELYEIRNYKSCFQLCESELSASPDDADILNYASMSLINTNQHERALPFLKRLFALDKANAKSAQVIGKCLQNIGDLENAIHWYQTSLAINPGLTSALNNLGFIYLQQKDFTKSEILFKKVLEIDNFYSFAWTGLSEVMFSLDKFDECKELTQQIANLNLSPTRVHLNAAKVQYRIEKNYLGAIKNLKKELTNNSKCFETLIMLGQTYMKLYKYNQAATAYRQAITVDANNSNLYVLLGTAQLELRKLDIARSCANKSIELDDTNVAGYGLLARIDILQGMPSNAITQLHQANNIKPSIANFVNLSVAYFQQEDIEKSLETIMDAIQLEENSYEAYLQLASIYQKRKNLNKLLMQPNKLCRLTIKIIGHIYYALKSIAT